MNTSYAGLFTHSQVFLKGVVHEEGWTIDSVTYEVIANSFKCKVDVAPGFKLDPNIAFSQPILTCALSQHDHSGMPTYYVNLVFKNVKSGKIIKCKDIRIDCPLRGLPQSLPPYYLEGSCSADIEDKTSRKYITPEPYKGKPNMFLNIKGL